MNSYRWMSRQFFSFYLTWGIFLPYFTGWMIHAKGMTVSQASLIMSLGLAIRGLSTLFAFPKLSDRLSSKTLINAMAFGTLIALLLTIPANTFTNLMAVVLLLHFFYPALMPALDTAAGVLVQDGQLHDYGKSRSWGSIGFVAGGMILTLFTGKFGDEAILWGLLAGILIFICLGLLRAPNVLSKKSQNDDKAKNSMLEVFKVKHFGIVLTIVILLQAAHASYYNYGYIYLQEIEAPAYLIGVIINIAVIAEIIFFMMADKAFRNFTPGSLLILAALGSTIRWILVFAFPNVIVFSLSQVLHACSFAMGHYAFMQYLIKNIDPELIPKAQGIYAAIALSWSTALLTIYGGFLYEIKPGYAFLGMIVSTIPSMLIAIAYKKLERKSELKAEMAG